MSEVSVFSPVNERVAKGMGRLDRHFGNRSWEQRIDIDRLAIDHPDRCVLGQVFADVTGGPYITGLMELNLLKPGGSTLIIEYGFSGYATLDDDALTEEWKKQLRESRA